MVLGFFLPAVLLVLLLLAVLLCVIGVLAFGSAAEDCVPSAACIPDFIFS
jgi:hypothetical protein